ncbi:MAG: DNA gyrase subunit A [Candidatus Parcubacteria bacterium]|nr:MAG: DNA gyrase subunit A [Candidatus Parcubacteria bacterium]
MKEKIFSQDLTEELRQAYLDYAMSVIVSRALPDARDGLKPVQRRILYTMKELSLWPNDKFTKCANIVGNTIARYHPHGDQAVYDALVRMAQGFSLRYPLIIGQGNFGSIDGDPPAAYRYTEAKLSSFSVEMLSDIDKETVDFRPNYDNTKEEPVVLPSRFPNLIVNGSLGIAVGMATSIPPHNLTEVMKAVKFLLQNNLKADIDELLTIIQGPDFPTGGLIYGVGGLKNSYLEGKGSIILRGEVITEQAKKTRLVIISLPWQVNKSELVKEIANLALEKVIPEIKDVRDESNKDGVRIVIDIKDGDLDKIKANLYRLTSLQKTFYLNLIALDQGLQPKIFNLKELLLAWIYHRQDVIRRRTKFDLDKNKERVHLLEGFDKALEDLDKVINIIKKSKDKNDALINLKKKFSLSDKQADAILEMPLRTLTQLERHKILQELKERLSLIKELETILKNPKKIDELIIKEADEIIKKYPSPRLTKIVHSQDLEISKEQKIPLEKVWLIIDNKHFVSLAPIDKLSIDKLFKKEPIKFLSIVNTTDKLLAISKKGRVYTLNLSNFYFSGKYLESQINLDKDDAIVSVLPNPDQAKYLLLITHNGFGKKVALKDILSNRRNGVQAIKMKNDFLVDGVFVQDSNIVGLINNKGNILLLKCTLPVQGKSAKGLKMMRDGGIEKVFLYQSDILLLIFEKGFYKKINLKEIKIQNRGTKGVKLFDNKYGRLLLAQTLSDNKEIIIFGDQLKRISLNSLSLSKRISSPKQLDKIELINSCLLL